MTTTITHTIPRKLLEQSKDYKFRLTITLIWRQCQRKYKVVNMSQVKSNRTHENPAHIDKQPYHAHMYVNVAFMLRSFCPRMP